MSDIPACPECNKMAAVQKQSMIIGEFLEWLQGERGLAICEMVEGPNEWGTYELIFENTETLLAEFFGIDLRKVEQEKQATLEWMRTMNG